MTVALLVRNRFVPIPEASARRLAANAWEIRLPRSLTLPRGARRRAGLDDWDGAVFSVDGVELEPAVATGETRTLWIVTALAL